MLGLHVEFRIAVANGVEFSVTYPALKKQGTTRPSLGANSNRIVLIWIQGLQRC